MRTLILLLVGLLFFTESFAQITITCDDLTKRWLTESSIEVKCVIANHSPKAVTLTNLKASRCAWKKDKVNGNEKAPPERIIPGGSRSTFLQCDLPNDGYFNRSVTADFGGIGFDSTQVQNGIITGSMKNPACKK